MLVVATSARRTAPTTRSSPQNLENAAISKHGGLAAGGAVHKSISNQPQDTMCARRPRSRGAPYNRRRLRRRPLHANKREPTPSVHINPSPPAAATAAAAAANAALIVSPTRRRAPSADRSLRSSRAARTPRIRTSRTRGGARSTGRASTTS